MTEQNLHDDFMKLGDMRDIDNRILAEAGQDDLIDRMHQQNEKAAVQKSPWTRELKEHWFLYSLLAASFLLTETLAIYLGTAPIKQTDSIYYHTDIGHLLTALVYMIVLPMVTEFAFDNSRKKFNARETGNTAQSFTMGASVFVSVLSWVGTIIAGGYVILSTLGSIGFLEIPHEVQSYLVWIIGLLIPFFALMHWLYGANSRFAKSQKLADEQEKNAELADQMRMKQIEQAGKRAIRAAAIRAYEQAVSMGLLSQDEAMRALAQGKSLAQLEMELHRDLTGEGKIGDTSGLQARLPAPVDDLAKRAKEAREKADEINRQLKNILDEQQASANRNNGANFH